MGYWERRRKSVKRSKGTWLATGKKNIFFSPDADIARMLYIQMLNIWNINFPCSVNGVSEKRCPICMSLVEKL